MMPYQRMEKRKIGSPYTLRWLRRWMSTHPRHALCGLLLLAVALYGVEFLLSGAYVDTGGMAYSLRCGELPHGQ